MFTLFKKRTFSDYISDTFTFLKLERKPFFKNFLSLCGPLLLGLVVCVYFLTDIFFHAIQSSNNDAIDDFITSNVLLGVLLGLITFVLFIIISVISYAYPVFYLKRMSEKKEDYQTLPPLKLLIKKSFGRLFVFGLGTLFLITPLILIAFSISAVLIFLLVGIPLLIILFPATASWISVAFFEYTTNNTGFFAAYSVSFNIIKQNFWVIIGNTFVFQLIIQIITSVFTLFPQMFFYGGLLTSTSSTADLEQTLAFKLFVIAIMVISIIVSVIINVVLLINQGLIYYSAREHKENNQSHFDIESIGMHND
ncbi:hypothetical protein [Myroides indicus]|uniref:Glycerophosphoryl diester phosphodiesterase family protein n=1 Tax=Myroides indicus TaxID=1323422 RepID=A0A4R7EYI8_9FLAO|nr:hypothetical protein [Myroides indicus]TDS56892.1 hypothetical protein C8P70_11841 [Myroides indicus]